MDIIIKAIPCVVVGNERWIQAICYFKSSTRGLTKAIGYGTTHLKALESMFEVIKKEAESDFDEELEEGWKGNY